MAGLTAVAELTHADDCTGTCGLWLAAGTPSCLPYPCMCAQTRADAKENYPWSDGKCWWVKKNTGQARSRCPCWNGTRDGRPGDCCSQHSANVLYATAVPVLADPDVSPADVFEVPDEPAGWHAPHDREPLWFDDEEAWGPDPSRERKPFVRRWEPAELTCDCELSYAKDKRSVVTHCTDCHGDFANVATASVHRRKWTVPCRNPWSIVDCDTGEPLMYQDGSGVWRDRYPSAA